MSNQVERLLREIHESLLPLVDPAYAKKMQQLVPSQWSALGVRVPKVRALAAEMKKRHPRVITTDLIALAETAFASHCREEVLCSIFWLALSIKREPAAPLWAAIDGWIKHIADWEICDQLAIVIGAPLVDDNPLRVADLVDWTGSPNPWRRRFTVATAAALNQKGRSNVPATLQICTHLLQDEEPIVRKAVGWALREASKKDSRAVFGFLYEQRTTTERSILREGSDKLPAEQRALLLADAD
ncbi:MAG: DNA alkylation repair protein [Caldilineaceae bacterium]|nr:DNA alkylation repair protein [Caldilineaceae bacterium]